MLDVLSSLIGILILLSYPTILWLAMIRPYVKRVGWLPLNIEISIIASLIGSAFLMTLYYLEHFHTVSRAEAKEEVFAFIVGLLSCGIVLWQYFSKELERDKFEYVFGNSLISVAIFTLIVSTDGGGLSSVIGFFSGIFLTAISTVKSRKISPLASPPGSGGADAR